MPKPANKPIIAVDVDDVIVSEAEFVIEYSNKHWGHSLSIDDYRENWSEMWQAGHEEVERRADILHAPGVVQHYRILDDAQDALKRLSNNYKMVILTSRRRIVRDETLAWLADNFEEIFEEVHFTGFWDIPGRGGHSLTKADLSKQIGANYLIDDQPKHCFAAAEAGIRALLFGDYAASRQLELPDSVVRCKDWQTVLEYFEHERG